MTTTIEKIETFDEPNVWMGYKLIMSDPDMNIIARISNRSDCCEEWGMHTENNLDDFVGAEYHCMDVSDIIFDKDDREMSSIHVSISTDCGEIVLIFYNKHNGYYPHDVSIISDNGVKNISI